MEHSKAIRPELLLLIAACTSAIPAALCCGLLNEVDVINLMRNTVDLTFLFSVSFLTFHAFNMALLARLSLGHLSSTKLELLIVVCFFLTLSSPFVAAVLSWTLYTSLSDWLRYCLDFVQIPLLFWLATACSFNLIIGRKLPVSFLPIVACSTFPLIAVLIFKELGIVSINTAFWSVVFVYLIIAIPSLTITAYFIHYRQVINPISADLEMTNS